ncbi:hypothetical protein V9T40_005517 [Parthenolecanium corni]|uniref:U3 small nucleolar RNA-associated protein 13 C-terminal domain-containing protein n=1 Tax=Parthenolecanium corni TaxID=536013 RepID=A0AAN9TES7_9HEMI
MNIEASLFYSILEFHKINDDEIPFASGDEQVVRGWHLQSDGEHQLLNKLVTHSFLMPSSSTKDEILALTFFAEEDEYLVVASNSSHLNVYDRNMNCSLLKSHSDCIISVATSPGFPSILVSDSKDHSVRVWMCKDGFFKCVASVTRHQASVGAVVFSHNSQDGKIINASEDQTLKVWKLPALKYNQCAKLEVFRTAIAHNQAINSICLSMRDDLIATGHDFFVLNCAFFNNGTQIVSCGNDGLVKVWTIKNNECVSTLDKHASKVWAIAVSSDENKFVTGGTDSKLVFWRDTTEESRLEEIKTTRERVEQEQHLSNLLQWEQLLDALQYAITLDRPLKVFKIIETLSRKQTKDLETVIGQLDVDQKGTIVKYASEWNENSRSSYIAQLVLSFLVPEIISNDIKLSNETLEGLIAYTNRHFNRLITLLEVQIVPFTVKWLEPHVA